MTTRTAPADELKKINRAGRKRNVPITLPKPSEVCVEDRPRLAKLRTELQADPMGIRRGEYAKRTKRTVGEATDERYAHAIAAGAKLGTEKERFEDGRPTGLQRKRFKSILEVWHTRKVIDKATFTAAETFQRDYDLSMEASPRMISRYGHIMPGGFAELLPQEVQIQFIQRKVEATASVDPHLHFILEWIASVSNEDVHPDIVAEEYWGHLSQKVRMERFKAIFEYVCMTLSVHYKQTERHRWVKLTTTKAANEIFDLLRK